MYIWVAIDVSEQVTALREKAEKYIRDHGAASPTLTLPFHISLKISFQISEDVYCDVVRDIRDLCGTLQPFEIPVGSIERNGSIIWLTMKDCAELERIHASLDKLLLEKHGVAQHEFDKEFIFHTSILIMDDEELLCGALDALADADVPSVLRAEKIIIGSSADGKAGTYCVDSEIAL